MENADTFKSLVPLFSSCLTWILKQDSNLSFKVQDIEETPSHSKIETSEILSSSVSLLAQIRKIYRKVLF